MLKNKLNTAMLFIVVLVIISLTNITALAAELPDLSAKGTIKISMKKDGKTIPGGEFEIYRIAEIKETNNSFKYVFTDDFKNCNLSLDNIESDKFSSDLESYIKNNNISGIRKTVDSNGIAKFSQLEVGIYFVVQNEAAKYCSKAASFAISLPAFEDGEYNYAVNANPKFNISRSDNYTQTTTVKPPNPTDDKPSQPNDTHLPKTGQLNLPIPILIISGICMFVLGLIIRCSGRKEENEK